MKPTLRPVVFFVPICLGCETLGIAGMSLNTTSNSQGLRYGCNVGKGKIWKVLQIDSWSLTSQFNAPLDELNLEDYDASFAPHC